MMDWLQRFFQILKLILATISIIVIIISSITTIITRTQQPTVPTKPYATYESRTDIPGLTLKIVWDTPTIQNQSIALSSSMQPSDIPKLQGQFGPNYDFFLTAQLNASAFTIDPKEQMQQPITAHTISFYWTATPTLTGKQAINLNVTGIWIPRRGGKQITQYLGDHFWHIQVDDPSTHFFTLGQLNLASLLTVLFTSFLTIPVWEFVKKKAGTNTTQQTPS